MPVIVTGTFILPDGDVAADRVITIRRASRDVVQQSGQVLVPDDVVIETDITGQVLFDLMPGNYVGFARTASGQSATFTMAVPDVETVDVAAVINADDIPEGAAVGPMGPPGPQGETGPAGASAYEIAVDDGFVGTEAAWLASLVGPAGQDGADGNNGSNGADGVDGLSAYQIAVSQGFAGSESAWLASLVGPAGDDGEQGAVGPSYNYRGESSTLIDQSLTVLDTFTHSTRLAGLTTSMLLKPKVARVLTLSSIADISAIFANYDVMLFAQNGAAGANGANGSDGSDGLSAYQIAVQNGFVGNEAQWLASLVGADGEDGAPGTNGTDGQSVIITTVTTQAAYDAATPTATQLIVRIA